MGLITARPALFNRKLETVTYLKAEGFTHRGWQCYLSPGAERDIRSDRFHWIYRFVKLVGAQVTVVLANNLGAYPSRADKDSRL